MSLKAIFPPENFHFKIYWINAVVILLKEISVGSFEVLLPMPTLFLFKAEAAWTLVWLK